MPTLRYKVILCCFIQSGAACERTELDAIRFANEMQAEYWSVSAKTGQSLHWRLSVASAIC